MSVYFNGPTPYYLCDNDGEHDGENELYSARDLYRVPGQGYFCEECAAGNDYTPEAKLAATLEDDMLKAEMGDLDDDSRWTDDTLEKYVIKANMSHMGFATEATIYAFAPNMEDANDIKKMFLDVTTGHLGPYAFVEEAEISYHSKLRTVKKDSKPINREILRMDNLEALYEPVNRDCYRCAGIEHDQSDVFLPQDLYRIAGQTNYYCKGCLKITNANYVNTLEESINNINT